MNVAVCASIPINLQLEDGNTSMHPVAYLFNADGSAYSTPSVVLAHIDRGLYVNSSVVMPKTALFASFVVYTDAGLSAPSTRYNQAGETITPINLKNIENLILTAL